MKEELSAERETVHEKINVYDMVAVTDKVRARTAERENVIKDGNEIIITLM